MLFTHRQEAPWRPLRGGRALGNSRRERGLHADRWEGSKSRGKKAERMKLPLCWVLKGFGKAGPACWWSNRSLDLGKERKDAFCSLQELSSRSALQEEQMQDPEQVSRQTWSTEGGTPQISTPNDSIAIKKASWLFLG